MLTRRELLRMMPALFIAPPLRAEETTNLAGIDTHLHIHREVPALYAGLKETNWSGLDIVVCPTEGDEPYDLESRLDATMKGSKASGGRLAWASTFDARGFESSDFAERTADRLRRTFDDGAIGVKIWKNIGMAIRAKSGDYLLPDNPALLPIYEAILKTDRTLIAHLAEPDGAWMPLDDRNPELPYYSKNPRWHMLGREGAPAKEAILTARDRVLARYPKLRVVGCHLGSDEDDLKRLARRLDTFPNFAVDTAARIRYFARGDRDQAREFLTKYQDRIIYATDFSLRDTAPETGARVLNNWHRRDVEFFTTEHEMEYEGRPTRGLSLPEPIVRKLFRDNARRWLPGVGV